MSDRLSNLDVGVLGQLIEAVADRISDNIAASLQQRAEPPTGSPWLDFNQARAYLGFSRDRLYKLTAARAIPCRKRPDGQRLIFHRDELDHWLETTYPRLDRLP